MQKRRKVIGKMCNTRRLVQFGFLALVLVGVYGLRAHAERWCPLGGLEGLYTYATEGTMVCSLAVSNLYLLGGVLLTALLLRRAFCGYACPIGTISDWTRRGARWLRLPAVGVSRPIESVLACGKYVVLGLILWATWTAGELVFRGYDPCYALIGCYGRGGPESGSFWPEDIQIWAYVSAGAILAASLFFTMPFCRWLCPMGAVLNPFSRFGLGRVRRDAEVCSDCGQCATSCPMNIPVGEVDEVRAARCIACAQCIDRCASRKTGDLALSWSLPAGWGTRWMRAALVPVFLACLAAAVAGAYLFPLPSFVKSRGERPDDVAVVELKIEKLGCRGRATRLLGFLNRDDILYEIPGYLKFEAWPGPGAADVRITYDPAKTDEDRIKEAIVMPYFDGTELFWSDFRIEGYDPLGMDLDPLGDDLLSDDEDGSLLLIP